ncbi:hypothetical protein PL81_30805 [Streptomyces sp. RSD-27]|nr:hypothetical protein PL81_30805 [Streptomyces sp. RSD-27]
MQGADPVGSPIEADVRRDGDRLSVHDHVEVGVDGLHVALFSPPGQPAAATRAEGSLGVPQGGLVAA